MSLIRMFNDKEKWCPQCKKWLPLNFFGMRKKSPHAISGKQAYCMECSKKYYRNYNTTEKRRKWLMKHRYNITPEKFFRILKNQNDKCAICDRKYDKTTKKFAVDHDHKTGEVRGILCTRCNLVLGYYDDKIETFERIIHYIQRTKKWPNIAL